MKIHTVTGQIDSSEMGYTLIHEHAVTCCDWSMRMCLKRQFCDPDRLLEMAVLQLKRAAQSGIRTIVDGTPINLGRDIALIKRASEESGVNIIVSSGFYHQQDPWLEWKPYDEILGYLDYECTYGLEETDVLPSIMKCAVDYRGITSYIEKMLGVTADCSKKHGIPIFCHTIPELKHGGAMLDIMEDHGVPMQAVVAGHSGDVDDIDYLESLARRGCYLGMDRFGTVTKTPGTTLENRCRTIVKLFEDGFGDKLLVSHDYAPYTGFVPDWKTASSDEAMEQPVCFTYFEKYAVTRLKELGLGEEQLKALRETNPRAFFENAY